MQQFASLTATVSDGFSNLAARQENLEKKMALVDVKLTRMKLHQRNLQHKQARAFSQLAEHLQLNMSLFLDFSFASDTSEMEEGGADFDGGGDESEQPQPMHSPSHSKDPSYDLDEWGAFWSNNNSKGGSSFIFCFC